MVHPVKFLALECREEATRSSRTLGGDRWSKLWVPASMDNALSCPAMTLMPISTFSGNRAPLSHKLELLHRELRRRYGAIDQVGVAVYDAQTDILKTFIGSDSALPALRNYQAKLADVPSLLALRDAGIGRVIDDLDQYGDPSHVHTRILLKAGYRSSYTVPMFARGEFFGFIFYDSRQPKYFRPEMLGLLEPFARLISLLVIGELSAIRTLTAATLTMRHIASRRDCETGAHLERMARFCQIIARQLATTHDLSDEYIEHLFLFAPLHDIGKIAIPDNILLKPGPLTDSEFALMREHTHKGQELVDFMLKEFGFTKLAYTEVLRNLVLYHHEAYDGSGYPQGLKGRRSRLKRALPPRPTCWMHSPVAGPTSRHGPWM